jgi:DNA-binding response OmpR family regulator
LADNRLPTILVVDDEEVIRFTIQKKLSRMGFNVISFEKGEDVIYYLKSTPDEADLIITDIKLRKMDGIELLRKVNALENPIPVLIISGHGNVEDAIRALRYGASDYIRKPFDINDLTSSVRSILRRKHEKKLLKAWANTRYTPSRYWSYRMMQTSLTQCLLTSQKILCLPDYSIIQI